MTDLKPIPTQKKYVAATSLLTDKPLHRQKRQENPSASVVHVTVTEASSVDYTYTETHFSYVPSSAPVITPDKIGNKGANASDLDLGVIIGGAVGGTALLVIICLMYFLLRRPRNKREGPLQTNNQTIRNTSYYQSQPSQPVSPIAIMDSQPSGQLVLPVNHMGPRERDIRYSQNYHQDYGYYQDVVVPFNQNAYYSGNNSTTSESVPSTAVDTAGTNGRQVPSTAVDTAGTYGRQVPNQIDNLIYKTNAEERFIPHVKDDYIINAPHTKD